MSTTLERPRKAQTQVNFDYPLAFADLAKPKRYKVFYGGRGSAKSWQFARFLLMEAMQKKHLILCTREFQTSIADSVHRTLTSQIYRLGLDEYFEIQQRSITCKRTGSEFIFKGTHHNIQEIKSLEGVTRCWIEEAQAMSEESWINLDPTIRESGSEIWISFNPQEEDDPIYQHFVVQPPPESEALIRKVSWRDNPWFPEELEKQRQRMLQLDPDAYDWVWEGFCRRISNASVFKDRFVVETFEIPETLDRFYFGADWGFANDPTVLIRCFIHDEVLYVDQEAYAINVEIDDIPALFAGGLAEKNGVVYDGIEGAKDWPIKADNSRPETISYLARRGFYISAAEKWPGSVEDGIAHLKGFKKIVIHPRCVNTAQEFRLYSYQQDKKTEDILPKLVDKFNHAIDAIRYSLDGYIQQRGGTGVWARLASW